jgi:hypothetical protein
MNSVDEVHPQMGHNVQASNGMEVSLLACGVLSGFTLAHNRKEKRSKALI